MIILRDGFLLSSRPAKNTLGHKFGQPVILTVYRAVEKKKKHSYVSASLIKKLVTSLYKFFSGLLLCCLFTVHRKGE